MATVNLQVNANTAQAVGAFNNLANAINNANGTFRNLNVTINQSTQNNSRYANSVTSINSAFESLRSIANGVFNALKLLGAGVQLVFASLIRELDKIQGFNAIMSVTTKSSETAAESYEFLRKTADKLGVQFDSLSSNYAKLVAALPEGANRMKIAEKVFLGIASASRTLHASNQDTQLMFYAVTQIASKGVVSMEELRRQLGEKLPGTISIAAKALNTLPETLTKAISLGLVDSAKFLPIFGDAMIRTFGESAEIAATSVSASINRLTNVWVDFTKVVLDSGGAAAISGVFDALREKLADPYVMARFAEMIKTLGDRVAGFIKNLTADDIRNGIDTFTKFIEATTTVVGKLVELLTWIINNGAKAGAVFGLMAGGAMGAVAGPYGAAVGALAGAGAGAYAGSQLNPSAAQNAERIRSDAAGQQAKLLDLQNQATALDKIGALLTQFKGANLLTKTDVQRLTQSDRLNNSTITGLQEILDSKNFKTEEARIGSVRDLAKFGIVLGNSNSTLDDVLGGNSKKKTDPEAKRLQATLNRANGLDPNFFEEMGRLNVLYKQSKLSMDQYTAAQQELLSKQPYMEAAAKREKDALEAANKGLEDNIQMVIKQGLAKEQVNRQLEDDLRVVSLTRDAALRDSELTKYRNFLADRGVVVTQAMNDAMVDQIDLILRTAEVTQSMNSVIADTVDKYRQAIVQQQAMDRLISDPKSGFTALDATNLTVNQDSNMAGSPQWVAAQKSGLQDYYSFLSGLRQNDRIDEESYNLAKSKSLVDLTLKLKQAQIDASNIRLSTDTGTGIDAIIASLGRLSVAFTTVAAGMTSSMGNFLQSFTDGFANAIGRSVVYSEDLGEAMKNVAREGVAALIASLIKLAIQWAVNAAIGTSVAASSLAASTTLSVAAAAATATAWAPAAAAVSLASFGSNSVGAMAGITSTYALTQGLALTSLAGFEGGGYTGNGGTKQIAGVVHGREFVSNAQSTARNRSTLEAMNRGEDVGGNVYITNAPVFHIDSRSDRDAIMRDVKAVVSTNNSVLVDKLQRARMLPT